ncbi:hypothetical protein CCR75_002984 [Bremia lactucae]|uniref:Uncharacterized protein n=1 Tax=Bremia lactucae TaxID=4779 RepID=A0A976FG23_BRELC|nr:hypothetical protein CCR75_002984 [Bremia lactucae]
MLFHEKRLWVLGGDALKLATSSLPELRLSTQTNHVARERVPTMSSATGGEMQLGSVIPIGASGARVQGAHVPRNPVERRLVAGGGAGAPMRPGTRLR